MSSKLVCLVTWRALKRFPLGPSGVEIRVKVNELQRFLPPPLPLLRLRHTPPPLRVEGDDDGDGDDDDDDEDEDDEGGATSCWF